MLEFDATERLGVHAGMCVGLESRDEQVLSLGMYWVGKCLANNTTQGGACLKGAL